MNKLYFLLIVFCSIAIIQIQAQTPDWVWAKSAKSNNGSSEGIAVATDKSENVYVVGNYRDTIIFGSHVLTRLQGGACIAKYDANGNIKWADGNSSNAGTDNCSPLSVSTDAFGNSYMTGMFSDTIAFGSFSLMSKYLFSIFLVKYDSIGNVVWARSVAGSDTNDNRAYGVATDITGNIYLTGNYYSSSIYFGNDTLTNLGSYDMFVAKFDSAGNVLWARSACGTSNEFGYSITTDVLNNVYVTGYSTSPTISFGTDTLSNPSIQSTFLAKYDSLGTLSWVKITGGISSGNFVATDASNNVYITGYFGSPSVTFGSDTLINTGHINAFLAKYDSYGNNIFTKQITGSGNIIGYSVSTDKQENVYVSGSFTSSSVIMDTIILQKPLTSYDQMFIVGYNSTGHVQFAKALASGGDDQNAITVSSLGCIYLCGDFEGVNPFIIGKDSLTLSGGEEIFVTKLCYTDKGESIIEQNKNIEFSVFPNPFQSRLNIKFKDDRAYDIKLIDVTSRELLDKKSVNSTSINTSELATGIYILQVRNEKGEVYSSEIVKD